MLWEVGNVYHNHVSNVVVKINRSRSRFSCFFFVSGLKVLNLLISSGRSYRLRADIGDWDGTSAYAVYDVFSVGGPETNYTLRVSGYHGTAGE
jgi:hypothetical protein